jgi:DNA-binding NtrC family response regulator
VRELENTLCQAMILCDSHTLLSRDIPPRIRGTIDDNELSLESDLDQMTLSEILNETVAKLEKRLIVRRLKKHRGNRTATAQSLGISRKTLFNKIRLHGIEQ